MSNANENVYEFLYGWFIGVNLIQSMTLLYYIKIGHCLQWTVNMITDMTYVMIP